MGGKIGEISNDELSKTNYKGETSTAIHENILEVREEACTRMTTAMRTSVGPSS